LDNPLFGFLKFFSPWKLTFAFCEDRTRLVARSLKDWIGPRFSLPRVVAGPSLFMPLCPVLKRVAFMPPSKYGLLVLPDDRSCGVFSGGVHGPFGALPVWGGGCSASRTETWRLDTGGWRPSSTERPEFFNPLADRFQSLRPFLRPSEFVLLVERRSLPTFAIDSLAVIRSACYPFSFFLFNLPLGLR